jgi:hypothetical protein
MKNRTNKNQKEGWRKLNAGACEFYKMKQKVHHTLKGLFTTVYSENS